MVSTSSVLFVGKLFWKPHVRRWADPVWVLDPSSAWLSTNTSRRQDERKRWLVLHVALPRLETQTWCYFLACSSVSHEFFSGDCMCIYIHFFRRDRFLKDSRIEKKHAQAEFFRHWEMDWHIYPPGPTNMVPRKIPIIPAGVSKPTGVLIFDHRWMPHQGTIMTYDLAQGRNTEANFFFGGILYEKNSSWDLGWVVFFLGKIWMLSS